MKSRTQLLVMSPAAKAMTQFLSLRDDPAYEVWLSYGEQLPPLENDFLFWGAGKFALGLKQWLPTRRFSSPGANWLPSVPEELSGRVVLGESFGESLGSSSSMPEKVWFKFAEMKHELIPARSYRRSELESLLESMPELHGVRVQWTAAHMRLNFEHRFFIVDGVPLTGSPYAVNGAGYCATISWNKFEEALKFAKYAARELVEQSPRAYTLDVALNEDTGNWLIVEANRSWSSGLYGTDVKLALESVRVALSGDSWEWIPDPIVERYTSSLRLADEPEFASGLLRLA